MKAFGSQLATKLRGGTVIELVGDVGAGKTVLVKGMAAGFKIDEDIQSPSFTISRVYENEAGLRLAHYDFYRLSDPGLMSDEINETAKSKQAVTVIEWADVVKGVLPEDRITITINSISETKRQLNIAYNGPNSQAIIKQLA